MSLGGTAFTWGAVNLTAKGQARASYLETLRIADDEDIGPLLKFARS